MAESEGKVAQAYREIEQLIVFQDIRPGALISESEMMAKTGLGRTPVREALQQLSRDRIVEIHPNKGVLVPSISVDAQLRRLELRRALEVLAVRLACERATTEQRRSIEQLLVEIKSGGYTLRTYADTIKRTHNLIASSANNEYVADAMAPLQALSRRFWITHVVDDGTEIKSGALLHIEILQAVIARDAEAAEQASLKLNDYLVGFAHRTLGLG